MTRDEAIAAVRDLAKFPANWDSYGAHPAKPDSIAMAVFLLESLQEMPETITLRPGGTVSLFWNGDDLDVEVHEDGTLECDLSIRSIHVGDIDRLVQILRENT